MKLTTLTIASAIALTAAVPAFAQTTSAKAGAELTVRTDPTIAAPITGVLALNEEVTIEGCLEDVSWCKVTAADAEGWASGQYLYVEDNANAVPLVDMAGNPEELVIITQTEEGVSQGDQNGAAVATATVGALTAFALGGPVGAIVASGIAGTAVGAAAVEPTPDTLTYVAANPVDTVYLDGEVVVGAIVPAEITTFEVPQPEYRYLNVNNLPVLVDAETGTIVQIIR
ncbi:DUF1236 domain-containing protein [Loktanella salsilacus]|jgi:uncharacterized protein YgiM (DUF1202 family)|uniref:SH3 domain-containing protein n=1 Tax=Loktanella salsilacus TaxID=195913 RepID=A0A1I4DTJ2_9RHOB|nr:DUF1236 domain-containing protein [Loktanella salsilacus]MBU0780100.1 DUF1236 domain-containing protein [Alphaproteobacteria bacterium]MBU1834987.1 DUF1236 domain-containing protein [Alphaproteobacteria bacterium]UTH43742.1 DUF1236 domain-containing protein [Loktanella salsilacus]UTH47452.1 DUF1236 domain-containing protein [Loktanella salsilacus]SFK96942.1 SH3 domain-containing protein [Loktanella salsilacus]